jgi:hypothetical protein
METVKISSVYDDIVNHCRTHGTVPSWAKRDQVQEVFDDLRVEDQDVEYTLYELLLRTR